MGGNTSNARQECNRRSRSKDSRFLFDVLSSSQERWGSKTCSQSQTVKPVCSGENIQNANTSNHCQSIEQRSLAGISGSEGCVLPCTDPTRLSTLPQIRVSGPSISIPGPSFRSVNGTKSVHKNPGTSHRPSSSERDSHIPLSGRLPDCSQVRTATSRSNNSDSTNIDAGRICNQFQEILPSTSTKTKVFRFRARHKASKGLSASGQSSSDSQVCPIFCSSRQVQTSSTVSSPTRSLGSLSIGSSMCKTVPETNSIVPELTEGCKDSRSTVSNNDSSQVVTHHSVVVGLEEPNSRSTLETTQNISNNDNRCLPTIMGGSSGQLESSGQMVNAPEVSPHQCVRNAGCSQRSESIPVQSQEQGSSSSDRQHDSSQLHQQSRGNQITPTLSGDLGSFHLVSELQHSTTSDTHSRQNESVGRQTIQTDAFSNRMGVEQSDCEQTLPNLAQTNDGSVCNVPESQTSSILLPIPSSSGVSSRRTVDELESNLRLCVPSTSYSQSSAAEGYAGGDYSDIDSSHVDQEGVVSSPARSDNRFSLSPSSSEGYRDSGTGDIASSQSSRTISGGMASKRNSLIAQGLSSEAADTCIAAKAQGTQRNYQSGWNHFCEWCTGQDIDPDNSSVATIVDYLHGLLTAGKSFHTARARISAIAFFHPGHTFHGTLGSHSLVRSFVSGARRKFPPVRDKFPSWDLPTVLKALMEHPFEPIQDLSLEQLTYKTFFLVAVCSARRLGELQALDARPPYCSLGLGGVVLKTHSSFVPKVPTIANIEKAVEFAPYGLADDGSELPERALCVCRALQFYIKATEGIRKTNQLFVTFGAGAKGRAASKPTLARWLKKTIQAAYELQNKPIPQGVKAHSTRHMSTSWADLKAISVLDICQQASWSTTHTFLTHYKLDLSGSVSSRHARAVLSAHSN